jgi:hypothetical protein
MLGLLAQASFEHLARHREEKNIPTQRADNPMRMDITDPTSTTFSENKN